MVCFHHFFFSIGFFKLSVWRSDTTRSTGPGEMRAKRCDTLITPRGVHTFLLFSSLPFIAYLHRAYAEDDGDEEEEDTAYNARGDRFVLNASRHGELHLVARTVIRSRVGEHLEIVGPTTDQVLHCGRSR